MELTNRQRLTRIFQRKPIDRPALKLWGAAPGMKALHPDYQPVIDRALQFTDLFGGAGSPCHLLCGALHREYVSVQTRPTADPLGVERVTTVRTPLGDMTGVYRDSVIGDPGFTTEYLVKDASDLQKLLSLPYEPEPVSVAGYHQAVADMGERGIVTFGLPHAGYGIQDLCGSETLAYFSVDDRELLDEVIALFASRIQAHARAVLATGIRPVFSWVGPEVFVPPLLSPRDFEDFIFRYDKPLCDLIHNGGGYVWVHSHNKVSRFLDRFIEMGVDVLNPLEPPKNGDIDLAAEVRRYGDRIGWEGNIEIQELLLGSPERIEQLIDQCLEAGTPSGRMILCPSAGFMEYAHPTAQYIENLIHYVEYGYKRVNAFRCGRELEG